MSNDVYVAKFNFVKNELTSCLQAATDGGVVRLDYSYEPGRGEIVTIFFENGSRRKVNVDAYSHLAIIQDVIRMIREEGDRMISMSPVCRFCDYLKVYNAGYGAQRKQYYCNHPRAEAAFEKYGLKSEPTFISFSAKMSSVPAIKTSPKWCPRRLVNTSVNPAPQKEG